MAVGLALIACLRLTGLDVTPLLTVGGISGVVLGFAAQGPLANLLAGLQLYISQPFVVGDKVEIKSAFGATIASGWVERIEPTRTYITNDKFVPLSLPNKVPVRAPVPAQPHAPQCPRMPAWVVAHPCVRKTTPSASSPAARH